MSVQRAVFPVTSSQEWWSQYVNSGSILGRGLTRRPRVPCDNRDLVPIYMGKLRTGSNLSRKANEIVLSYDGAAASAE
jgi:hypothetical protein